MDAPATPTRLRAAYVLRSHGLGGELRVEPLGGDAARFAPGLRLTSEDGAQTYTVCSARAVPPGEVLLRVEEVTTRDGADRLRGNYLCVDRGDVRRLDEDEWLVADLVGLRAVDEQGVTLGTVADVEAYAENDVLVVDDGSQQRRFPMVRAFVRRVDLVAGVVELTPWDEDR